MTTWLDNGPSRQLVCSGCGTEFTCTLSGRCWCAEETARLPLPAEGGECLCRDCLRNEAKRSGAAANSDTFQKSSDH